MSFYHHPYLCLLLPTLVSLVLNSVAVCVCDEHKLFYYIQLVTTAACDEHLMPTTQILLFSNNNIFYNTNYLCLNIKYLYTQLH